MVVNRRKVILGPRGRWRLRRAYQPSVRMGDVPLLCYIVLTRAAALLRLCIILRLWSSVLWPELSHLPLRISSWFTHRYVSSSMLVLAPKPLMHREQRSLCRLTSTCPTATFH